MLLFDLTATQSSPESRFHGGSEYAKQVFFSSIERGYKSFTCVFDKKRELDEAIKKTCFEHGIEIIGVSGDRELVDLINSNRFAKFYSALPYHLHEIKTDKLDFIMTVHGLREIECGYDPVQWHYRDGIISKVKLAVKRVLYREREWKFYYNRFERLLSKSRIKVITVSEHSKHSMLCFYPYLKGDDIYVSPAPCPFGKGQPLLGDRYTHLTSFGGSYFLLVSANRWMKNNYRAIKALDHFYTKNKNCEIVTFVLGKNKPHSDIQNKDKFVFIDYVDSESLDWFYKNAYAFIYPSLNEGYGYPPLQAMQYGTPVIASAVSSIPEVCKDSVLYFNPTNIDEIENRISQIYYNKELYRHLAVSGDKNASEVKLLQQQKWDKLLAVIFGYDGPLN
ncbi:MULTISPECIES: glycosyltransferase [Serratia]|uniref:glycosyltransferase n=2 Tax=Serratia TaxID=613 RepID=UPI0011C76741|nr:MULTISPECIES: glycosyltransferase [Serratia]MDI6973048.1 glycosyltransferase [Serratia sp. Se-RSBMAAmG]MDI9262016.1 glycosyltransferase [Serratia sp. PF2-63]TXE52920.1 glycosyltransferase family 4 protein [Serratia bockelmannii]CAI1548462.1 glycogen synthase, Corynebacterium family [Serratia marcescens]CAI1568418.1 glycogen synthase, Corynebacterium family [Serratia marcescens]